jgi:hypothetical protein
MPRFAASSAEEAEVRTMQTTIPTRITIELEPVEGRSGGWRAHTTVDDRIGRREADRRSVVSPILALEEADVAWTPAPYEPGPCTCEDGICDRDHENE